MLCVLCEIRQPLPPPLAIGEQSQDLPQRSTQKGPSCAHSPPRRSRRSSFHRGPWSQKSRSPVSSTTTVPGPLLTAASRWHQGHLCGSGRRRGPPLTGTPGTLLGNWPILTASAIRRCGPLPPGAHPHPAQAPPSIQGRCKNKTITPRPSGTRSFTACPPPRWQSQPSSRKGKHREEVAREEGEADTHGFEGSGWTG